VVQEYVSTTTVKIHTMVEVVVVLAAQGWLHKMKINNRPPTEAQE
jgi:hypothetical protein